VKTEKVWRYRNLKERDSFLMGPQKEEGDNNRGEKGGNLKRYLGGKGRSDERRETESFDAREAREKEEKKKEKEFKEG